MFKELVHGIVWTRRHRSGAMRVLEFECIRPLLKRDSVALDIGAHGGSWCAALSKAMPQGQVYAFEALPYYASALKWTRRLRGWKNVTILNKAVMDKPQTVNMVWKNTAGKKLTGTTHVQGSKDDVGASVSVQGITLDDFVKSIPGKRVNFIKCDVEGFELNVLRGSVKLIEQCRPLFWCELWAEYTKRYNYTPADIFQFFTDRKYKTYMVHDGKLTPTDAATYPGQGDILAAPVEIEVLARQGG